jgi:hypothetical protein
MKCGTSWNGDYFMGGLDGAVYIYDGVLDGTTIDKLPRFDANPTTLVNSISQVAPGVNDYVCDGLQVQDETNFITQAEKAIVGAQYEVTYTVIGSSGGEHGVMFGRSDLNDVVRNTGNGVFTHIYVAQSDTDLVTLFAGVGFDGNIAGIQITEKGLLGESINFRTLTSFQSPDEHSQFKRAGFIRTLGVLAGTASLNVRAIFDYAIETEIKPPPQSPSQGQNLWDSAVWDESLWDFSVEGVSLPVGALGMGRTIALATRGNSNTRINIVGWDLMYTRGGYL